MIIGASLPLAIPMRLLLWLLMLPFSRRFQFAVFSLLSVAYWVTLICLAAGCFTEPSIRLWLSAIGGSFLFTALAYHLWRDAPRSRASTDGQTWNDECWKKQNLEYLQQCLVRRVTVAEVEGMCQGKVAVPAHLWLAAEDWPFLSKFFDQNLAADDEVWLYDNGEEMWNNLAGTWGFAIVHEGKVRAWHEVAMN